MEPYGATPRVPRAAPPPSASKIKALKRKNGFPMQNGTKKPSLNLHNVYKGCARKSETRPRNSTLRVAIEVCADVCVWWWGGGGGW